VSDNEGIDRYASVNVHRNTGMQGMWNTWNAGTSSDAREIVRRCNWVQYGPGEITICCGTRGQSAKVGSSASRQEKRVEQIESKSNCKDHGYRL